MNNMGIGIVYNKMPTPEVNGAIANRAVRVAQEMAEAIAKNQNKGTSGENIVQGEQTDVKAEVAFEQPQMTPDVSIDSFSVKQPEIPKEIPIDAPQVVTTPNESEIVKQMPDLGATPPPPVNPQVMTSGSEIPETPVVTPVPEQAFVSPVIEIPDIDTQPKEEEQPMQNNGFGVPAPAVNNTTMPEESVKENIVNLNDEVVIKYLKEKLAQSTEIDKLRSTVESQKIELEAKDKKLSAVNNALTQIQTAVNSQPIEEPGEVFRKAA